MAHTKGIEGFWAVLKCAHKGAFRQISPKHLDRYVAEIERKHNIREERHTHAQMKRAASSMEGKRLRHHDPTAKRRVVQFLSL